MKRMIHALLATAVLVSAMTCTVFAGDYTADQNDYEGNYVGTVTTADDGKSFTVSYDDATAGEQYAVLIIKVNPGAESPYDAADYNAAKEENIIYINQDGAASDGSITFEGLIPMTSANAIVLLGGMFGEDVQSPVILGELKMPFIYGDVYDDNGNRVVDLKDAVKLLQYVAKVKGVVLTPSEELAADVYDDNGNGVVDLKDAVKLLQFVAKVPGVTLP